MYLKFSLNKRSTTCTIFSKTISYILFHMSRVQRLQSFSWPHSILLYEFPTTYLSSPTMTNIPYVLAQSMLQTSSCTCIYRINYQKENSVSLSRSSTTLQSIQCIIKHKGNYPTHENAITFFELVFNYKDKHFSNICKHFFISIYLSPVSIFSLDSSMSYDIYNEKSSSQFNNYG